MHGYSEEKGWQEGEQEGWQEEKGHEEAQRSGGRQRSARAVLTFLT
jgi:hypothetical protein